MEKGYLELTDDIKLPTEIGKELGIITTQRHSEQGDYTQCLFGSAAQRLCGEMILREIE